MIINPPPPPKRVRGATNDWDGVHVESFRSSLPLVTAAARAHGLTVDARVARRLIRYWGLPGAVLVARSFHVTHHVAREVYETWDKAGQARRYPQERESRATARGLYERGVIQTILTSRNRESFKTCFAGRDLDNYFSHQTTHCDTPYHKPDPRSHDRTLDFFRNLPEPVDASEIIFIGDTRSDYDAAVANGIFPLIVASGPISCLGRGDINPIHIIPHIGGVIPRLERLGCQIG